MTAGLVRSVELHDHERDSYSRSLGRQLVVSLVVRGDGGAVTLDVNAGWALVPFGGGWELGADDRAPRDDGVHIHIDPCARTVDDPWESYGQFDNCTYTGSGRCRLDVGALGGHRVAVVLASDGVAAAFDELEKWYRDRIGDAPVRPDRLDELGDADAVVTS